MGKIFAVQSMGRDRLRTYFNLQWHMFEYDRNQEKIDEKAGKYVRIIWDERTSRTYEKKLRMHNFVDKKCSNQIQISVRKPDVEKMTGLVRNITLKEGIKKMENQKITREEFLKKHQI